MLSRLAAMLVGLLPLCATAGSLRVGPTGLELSARHPVAVLEVQNTGDAATLAQLDAFVWTQAGTVDLLESTGELVTTPLVVKLAAGETRLVRIGLREPNRTSVERSYRIFVREVPPAAETGKDSRTGLAAVRGQRDHDRAGGPAADGDGRVG